LYRCKFIFDMASHQIPEVFLRHLEILKWV
jgi:hypothetical protein